MRRSCFAKVSTFKKDLNNMIAKLFTENIAMLNAGQDFSIADMRVVTWENSTSTSVAIILISTYGDVKFADNHAEFTVLATGSYEYPRTVLADCSATSSFRSAATSEAVSDMLGKLRKRVALFAPTLVGEAMNRKVTVHNTWYYGTEEYTRFRDVSI